MTVSDILSCRGTFDFGRRYEIRWLVAGVDCGELNPNDSITRTRGVAYPARVCIPAVEVDIFYPSSCKPIVVAPHPPDSGNFFAHIVHTARVRSPLTTDDVVPLGTAVGPLGAARIKTRVRTLLYVCQRVSREAPPR